VGARIYEVGVAYHGRTYAEGKKIGMKDGFRALWCILKYGFKEVQRLPVEKRSTAALEAQRNLS
jgi:hypothetical protein